MLYISIPTFIRKMSLASKNVGRPTSCKSALAQMIAMLPTDLRNSVLYPIETSKACQGHMEKMSEVHELFDFGSAENAKLVADMACVHCDDCFRDRIGPQPYWVNFEEIIARHPEIYGAMLIYAFAGRRHLITRHAFFRIWGCRAFD